MCFIINERTKIPKIAKYDIPCYKIVTKTKTHGSWKSFWENFPYRKGYHYYQDKPLKILKSCTIGKYIGEGLHSYIGYYEGMKAVDVLNAAVILCYIPAGSTYYIDRTRRVYVSTDLVIVDGVKSK